MHTVAVYPETEGCTDGVPSLYAAGAGIDGQHPVFVVIDDFQYMGMPAYEDVGPEIVDECPGSQVIPSGISPDMGHQDLPAFTFETQI